MPDLFSPVTVGKWTLPNRIAMAPMTRSRADASGVPGEATATYYRQRATAGLIITEGVQPSATGQGYSNTPGLHTRRQIRGWRAVADSVHEEGGHIVAQIMHAGRIAHPDNKNGHETVAPSALAAPGEIFTPSGPRPHPVPRALTTAEIPSVIEEYVDSARAAVEAGLDGIELHGANGYLIHQFLAPSTNHRTDTYGGSTTGRARFAIDLATAVAEAVGSERVGLRISPGINLHGAIEDDPAETAATYRTLIDAITPLGLAYLHTIGAPATPLLTDLRTRFDGTLIVNDGWYPMTDATAARRHIDSGRADLVSVGRAFIANPDLVRRWQNNAPSPNPIPPRSTAATPAATPTTPRSPTDSDTAQAEDGPRDTSATLKPHQDPGRGEGPSTAIAHELNHRPRKTHGYRTPAEVYAGLLNSGDALTA